MSTLTGRLGSLIIAVATALAIVAVTLPLFLNPLWVAFEQDRADAAAWTRLNEPQLRLATDAILADLVLGPPDFDVEIDGTPVLNERERGHMRDVRAVFMGFFGLTLLTLVGALVIAARRRGDARATWSAVRAGAVGLVVVLASAGVLALVAFDVLFELFHRVFFPGGTYTFDPATERLVQLFPFQFWQESAIAVGAVCIALAVLVGWTAHRHLVASTRPGTTDTPPATVRAGGAAR